MIVVIGSQKGGCGKSTLSINICAELARQGKDVMLVDADRQSSSSFWALERSNNNADLPKVHCAQKYDNIKDTLIDFDSRYEIVIVDAAGRDSIELRSALLVAHKLIIPLRPAIFDLETLPKMQDIIEQCLLINPKLDVYATLTMCPTNPVVGEKDDAVEYLADFPGINLTKTIIRDRKIYRDSTNAGKGVVELEENTSESGRKAKQEIKDLIKEVL
jgi:chromosome partitioning protein